MSFEDRSQVGRWAEMVAIFLLLPLNVNQGQKGAQFSGQFPNKRAREGKKRIQLEMLGIFILQPYYITPSISCQRAMFTYQRFQDRLKVRAMDKMAFSFLMDSTVIRLLPGELPCWGALG